MDVDTLTAENVTAKQLRMIAARINLVEGALFPPFSCGDDNHGRWLFNCRGEQIARAEGEAGRKLISVFAAAVLGRAGAKAKFNLRY